VAGAAGSARDGVANAAGNARDGVAGAAGSVRDGASNVAGSARDGVSSAADTVSDGTVLLPIRQPMLLQLRPIQQQAPRLLQLMRLRMQLRAQPRLHQMQLNPPRPQWQGPFLMQVKLVIN